MSQKWKISIDRGGTFTDIWAVSPDGKIHVDKILGNTDDSAGTIIDSVKRILNVGNNDSIPAEIISSIRIGTTLVTNALLERKGRDTALFITEGFRDLLEIGDQTRPDLFDLNIRKPENLYSFVTEIKERINTIGEIEKPLIHKEIEQTLKQITSIGYRSLAIVFLNSWKNNIHELQVKEMAVNAGIETVITSSELLPIIRVVPRGQTTVLEAYLYPLLAKFINQLKTQLGIVNIEFMQSSGGLIDSEKLLAHNTLLSGPAGGVSACMDIYTRTNKPVIGFDMGGTSTDVSRYGGQIIRKTEAVVAGIRHRTNMLDIETVAAGGGSICEFKDGRYQVGPESAGADPGPACYGLGGPATITDANLILGRIAADKIQPTFGKNRQQPLDKTASRTAFQILAEEINQYSKSQISAEQTALGFISIADETMARSIRSVSLKRGYDARKHILSAFGGAGPQHACGIADKLGIKEIIVSPWAGILSAYGISKAPSFKHTSKSFMKPLIQSHFDGIINPSKADPDLNIELDIRIMGSDSILTIPVDYAIDNAKIIAEKFLHEYENRYGIMVNPSKLEIVNVHEFEASALPHNIVHRSIGQKIDAKSEAENHPKYNMWLNQSTSSVPLIDFDEIASIQTKGPALIWHRHFSVVILPNYSFSKDAVGNLRIKKIKELSQKRVKAKDKPDPVLLEIFNHRFMGIAEQMGYTLENTAHSVNIKERRDFSCALFDSEGRLIANAPHIPVHLGSMGETVRAVMQAKANSLRHGNVYVTNHPHKGGSHLPDITLVTPVMVSGEMPDFFIANRGHHADIGGITPGSMPPNGKRLEDEGIILENVLFMRSGEFCENTIFDKLSEGPFPARNLKERMSDLKAQTAANLQGISGINALVNEFLLTTVKQYMTFIRRNAAMVVSKRLHELLEGEPKKSWSFQDSMDDGTKICASMTIREINNEFLPAKLTVDFEGTGDQSHGNLNAPSSVTRAAVMYVLRCMLNRNIPLNSGFFDPVELVIPKGCILNPQDNAAVVGGNVETSQRVVDVLLGAFGMAAASQGTMNNFLFGHPDGKDAPYYETIGGGSGAGKDFDGADGVQVHMTNTRITDPEILEFRYPELRLDKFSFRQGSGGKGRFNGGDGLERVIRFLERKKVTILSERRQCQPFGMEGGSDGKLGKNILLKRNGDRVILDGKAEVNVQPGDSIIIKSPGGGGYGESE